MANYFLNIDVDCKKCFKRSGNVFSCLSKTSVELLNQNKTTHIYQRGQIIFYEGNPAFAMYCILSGSIKLYKTKMNGDIQVVRLLGPGEVFGYRPIFSEEPYAVTAEAVERSELCIIPKNVLILLLKKEPELSFKFLAKLAKELRISEEKILALTENSVLKRTVELLLQFAGLLGEKTKTTIKINSPISRYEMAQIINTTPESLSRTLHLLAKKGIIELNKNEITILNITELTKLTNPLK